MKEWMIGVNGTFWRHKHDDHTITKISDNLVRLDTFNDRTQTGSFVGQIVVVFDPADCVSDQPPVPPGKRN